MLVTGFALSMGNPNHTCRSQEKVRVSSSVIHFLDQSKMKLLLTSKSILYPVASK